MTIVIYAKKNGQDNFTLEKLATNAVLQSPTDDCFATDSVIQWCIWAKWARNATEPIAPEKS